MGRGRSKAKQTKVARDLKYSNQDMDLEQLVKELHKEIEPEGRSRSKDSHSEDESHNL